MRRVEWRYPNDAARPARGILARFAGQCCEGSGEGDSTMPCKIDLRDTTSYHFNMKKSKGTQESTGAAAKGTPGKRTATNAAKPKKTGKTANEMRKETNAKIAAKAERILNNISKSAPLYEVLRSIPHERAEEWIEGVRKCLKSDAFDGMCAVFYFEFIKGRTPALKLNSGSPILESIACKSPLKNLNEQLRHPEKFYAQWEECGQKEKDDILNDLVKCVEKQKEAEATYRGEEGVNLDGLCNYLHKNRDWLKKNKRLSIKVYVTKKKEADFIIIPWYPPVNDKKYATMTFRYSRRDEKAIKNLKAALVKHNVMTITSMSAFIVDAVIKTMTLMVRYRKPAEFIFKFADLKLMEMATYEQSFTNEEVRELVNTEDIEERRGKHEKMVAKKAVFNEKLVSDFWMGLLERSGRLDLS